MPRDKDNSGAIWKNERREKDTHPHFTGSALIDGVDYWVSAWKRDTDAKPNSPALKFSFRPKEERKQPPKDHVAEEPLDDDIPF